MDERTWRNVIDLQRRQLAAKDRRIKALRKALREAKAMVVRGADFSARDAIDAALSADTKAARKR